MYDTYEALANMCVNGSKSEVEFEVMHNYFVQDIGSERLGEVSFKYGNTLDVYIYCFVKYLHETRRSNKNICKYESYCSALHEDMFDVEQANFTTISAYQDACVLLYKGSTIVYVFKDRVYLDKPIPVSVGYEKSSEKLARDVIPLDLAYKRVVDCIENNCYVGIKEKGFMLINSCKRYGKCKEEFPKYMSDTAMSVGGHVFDIREISVEKQGRYLPEKYRVYDNPNIIIASDCSFIIFVDYGVTIRWHIVYKTPVISSDLSDEVFSLTSIANIQELLTHARRGYGSKSKILSVMKSELGADKIKASCKRLLNSEYNLGKDKYRDSFRRDFHSGYKLDIYGLTARYIDKEYFVPLLGYIYCDILLHEYEVTKCYGKAPFKLYKEQDVNGLTGYVEERDSIHYVASSINKGVIGFTYGGISYYHMKLGNTDTIYMEGLIYPLYYISREYRPEIESNRIRMLNDAYKFYTEYKGKTHYGNDVKAGTISSIENLIVERFPASSTTLWGMCEYWYLMMALKLCATFKEKVVSIDISNERIKNVTIEGKEYDLSMLKAYGLVVFSVEEYDGIYYGVCNKSKTESDMYDVIIVADDMKYGVEIHTKKYDRYRVYDA